MIRKPNGRYNKLKDSFSPPTEFDLTDAKHHQLVKDMADAMISSGTINKPSDKNIFRNLAFRMAKAKKYLSITDKPLNVLVVTNLLGEHNRLRPSSPENPNGEDSLIRKLEEIEWLTEDNNSIKIDLLYVSGQDLWNSEEVLEDRLAVALDKFPEQTVRLIKTREYPEWEGRNTNDKGGEWNLGIRLMVSGRLDKSYDAAYLTDADLMINLAAGLGESIVYHLENDWDVILGNRKDPDSKVQKNLKRHGVGTGWQYLITRYLARKFYEEGVLDTQCPSRFYSLQAAEVVDSIASIDTWTVETDHNLALMSKDFKLHFIPLTAVDSEKESVGLRLPIDDPEPSFRIAKIINGQIQIVHKYSSFTGVSLPKVEDSLAMERVVKEEIFSYNTNKPWKGLTKLLDYDDEDYSDWPLTDFTPENITIEEFKRIVKKALNKNEQ